MSLIRDAFIHLPHLRDWVTPTAQSRSRITPEVLAGFDELAGNAGYAADWRQSDRQIEGSWRSFLSSRSDPGDLWIFGYGSLMWDPGFHYTEVRLADIDGYQRRFTFRIEIGSGSPERPGLALSLERQAGRCKGLVFRIAADSVQAESEILWRREMLLFNYLPALVQAATPQGNVAAVAFVSDRSHPRYVGELPLDETAAIIDRGVGIRGANRDYIDRLASALEMLDVDDPYVTQLLARIDALDPGRVRQ